MNKYGMIYHKIHERAVNGESFKEALKEIKECCVRKGISSPIFIMDNARIHHYRGLRKDEEAASYRINYFPPYSPFLSPLENVFSVLKNSVVRCGVRTEAQLRTRVSEKFSEITSNNCEGIYRKMLAYLNRAAIGEVILK
ncbi:hypothetical protein CDIK_4090 [Cucumispora dikerogammari]|nr:hypothetical protein CDIK_4090 [Cucumispora dikerogammari]